jgi:hypothetical protein
MSYSTEISKTLSETLARFVTLNPHQLAGHAANLDFWLAETKHCVSVIDGYRKRFEEMKAAQMNYVAAKGTVESASDRCDGYCPICEEHSWAPARSPKSVPDKELREASQSLRDAAYRFILRCYNTGFIGEKRLREAADSIGTGVDVSDLK